jgi:hypothetical protein
MIQIGLFDILDFFFNQIFTLSNVLDVFDFEKYNDDMRAVNIEEMAEMFYTPKSIRDRYFMSKTTCLHRNPDFQEFLMSRPYYKIKYHRKRSDKYRYIGSTITKMPDTIS